MGCLVMGYFVCEIRKVQREEKGIKKGLLISTDIGEKG